MKRIVIALSLVATASAWAFPSWMGVYGPFSRHTDTSDPGTFTILLNEDYFGLHANVGIRVNSQTWTENSMSYVSNYEGNAVWTYTPAQAYADGAIVEYYFHGYEDSSSSNIYDSNGSTNYFYKVFAANDPELTSWFTSESAKYARVRTSDSAAS